MPYYRKKPVTIEAEQITERIEIQTLEGKMVGEVGDWLITGVEGEKYPCKPDIFIKTYEVEVGTPQMQMRRTLLNLLDIAEQGANHCVKLLVDHNKIWSERASPPEMLETLGFAIRDMQIILTALNNNEKGGEKI